jgi:N-succinyldiaminopimelate aminotransferase
MNPNLDRLQSYPFQKLTDLLARCRPKPGLAPINLSIGEPKHATPEFILKALTDNLSSLSIYPSTLGGLGLRQAIATWLTRRYELPAIDPEREIIPVNGSREALFAFAQAAIDSSRPCPVVVSLNPLYQIYEGAALLAGATPHFLNTMSQDRFAIHFEQLPDAVWQQTQLVYACSPGNPTGAVITLEEWKQLFALSDRHGFIIASDECYSEIYFDEHHPPLGALQAANRLGRAGYPRLVVFSSLSKRSNVPGLRSGFVAGNADLLKDFLLYRTYHGCSMSPPTHAASIAAWQEESHVVENRRLYRAKFDAVTQILSGTLPVEMPQAGFYLWFRTPVADTEFTLRLYRDYNVLVLPGSYIGRKAQDFNPGQNHVRVALVAPLDECVAACRRIAELAREL